MLVRIQPPGVSRMSSNGRTPCDEYIMAQIFLVSDTHFGHANLLTFTTPTGELCRPGFACVEEMDECMVDRWNAVVKPSDHVYHLGDVAMAKRHIPTVGRCNGKKRLVLGNHDEPFMKLYTAFFDKIMSSRLLDDLLLTHIPVHPGSLKEHTHRWTNVHGHVHNNVSRDHYGPAYYNVCVEYTGYAPVPLEEVQAAVRKQRAAYDAESARMDALVAMQIG